MTCQILPADFPGHQNYCPYTTGTQDGTWHGPDLAKARRLVRDSRTANVPVTVWTFGGAGDKARAPISSSCSKTSDTGQTSAQYPQTGSTAGRRRPQPDPDGHQRMGCRLPQRIGFLPPQLSCRSFYRAPTNTPNYAEFCDPHADKLAGQAQAAQLTDPAAARTSVGPGRPHRHRPGTMGPDPQPASTTFVSARVGNYQASPEYGPLLDQIWVR